MSQAINEFRLTEPQKQIIEQMLSFNPNAKAEGIAMGTGIPAETIQHYLDQRAIVPEPATINLSAYLNHSIFNTTFTKSHLFTPIKEATEGGAPKTIYEKAHENKKHRQMPNSKWIGKIGYNRRLHDEQLPPNAQPTRRTRSRREQNADAVLEFIANSIYILFGPNYLVPELKLADLPLVNEYLTWNFLAKSYQEDFEVEDCLHVMSKFMEDFTNFGELYALHPDTGQPIKLMEFIETQGRPPEQVIDPKTGLKAMDPETHQLIDIVQQTSQELGFIQKYGRLPDTVMDPKTGLEVPVKKMLSILEVPLRGIMDILAVGSTIADTDVLGGGGKNAGITFKTLLGGAREAVAINIDPGYAFNFTGAENKLAQHQLQNPKDIQLGNNSPIVVQWSCLTGNQRIQYLEAKRTIFSILQNEAVLDKLFLREELIQRDYERYEALVEDHKERFLSAHWDFNDPARFAQVCPPNKRSLLLDALFDEAGTLIADPTYINTLIHQDIYIQFKVDGKDLYYKSRGSDLSPDILTALYFIHHATIKNISLLFNNKGVFIGDLHELRSSCHFIKLYAKGKQALYDIRDLSVTKELLQELHIIHHAEYKFTPENASYYRDALSHYVQEQEEIFQAKLLAYEADREAHLFKLLVNDIHLRLKSQYSHASHINRVLGNPLPLAQCYTNLAIVKESEQKEKQDELQERAKEATEKNENQLGILGDYEDIHQAKEEIEFEKLFSLDAKRLLVLGRAGIGKSTFCQKIVHEWGGGTLWDGLFDEIFWIKLREITPERFPKKQDNAPYSTAEIIQSLCFGDTLTLTQNNLNRLHQEKTILYLLDGYDEITHLEAPENAYLKEVVKTLTTESEYQIITSRPHELIPLKKIKEKKAHIELEIIGFTNKDIDRFIENPIILENPEHQLSLKAFLQKNAAIKTQCHVPIQLDLITVIWADEGSEMMKEGSLSMSLLYQKLTKKLETAYFKKLGEVNSSARAGALARIQALERIAYDAMLERKVIIPYKITKRAGEKEGLLVSEVFRYGLLNPIGSELIKKRSGFFLHLSYQEYLAGRYLVRQWRKGNKAKLEDFIHEKRYDDTYEMMLIFIAGQMETQDEAMDLFELVYKDRSYGDKLWRKAFLMLNELKPELMDEVNDKFVHFGYRYHLNQIAGILRDGYRFGSDPFQMLSTLSKCQALLGRYPDIINGPVTVHKLSPPIPNVLGGVSFTYSGSEKLT